MSTERKVEFIECTKSEYENLSDKKDNTLYFTDDGDLYKGATAYSENVQSDWNETDTTSDAFILNKPTSMPASDVHAWAKADEKPSYTATEVGALPDTTEIPTESTVSSWGFTKNTGTYSKPETGIPKTDLEASVQTSLGKADTALQEHQSLEDYVRTDDSRLSDSRPASDVKDWAKADTKPTYTASEVGALPADTDLSVYALATESGYDLGLTLNSSTYEMTLELKNKAGTVLSTKTIDFPIESMVVNATYTEGVITLTLQNGTTLDVDISAIVGGLVNDSFTIAGIDMKDNITASELKTALGIPTVGNGTITITQNGTTKGTFTTNQSGNTTIELTDNDTDTKNTAGSTDTSSKIFLVGATSQAANPQTYSDNQVYATNGQLNGNSMRVAEKVVMQYNSDTESLDFVFE